MTQQTVWVIEDSDYDSQWIVAVYPTKQLADEHVALMGGFATENEILHTLHPDATDPAKQAERAREADEQRRAHVAYQEAQARDAKLRDETRPRPPHMGLCHCQTFSKSPMWNAHGYCSYCGGFSPPVFLANMGRERLHAEIDKLALRDREKMRQIVECERQQ